MDSEYREKKFWADKIAFLGLFAAALFIAHLIVVRRSAVVFSEPIELNYSGVSVSVPVGDGWENDKSWKYEENGFTVNSFFNPGAGNPVMSVRCRYLLAAEEESADAQLERKARAVGGEITEKGQVSAGPVVVKRGHIKGVLKGTKSSFDVFFGTAQLQDNRRLSIEVHQSANYRKMAEEVFRRVAESVRFKGAPLLEAGGEVVTEIKSKGLGDFLSQRNQQTYFVIRDSKEEPTGFIINVLADVGEQVPMNVQAASFLYVQGRFLREQVVLFQSGSDLSEYVWKSEVTGRFGRSGSEAVFDKTGVLAVKEYSPFVFSEMSESRGDGQFEERFCRPGPAAIPDIVGDSVFEQMLNSGCEKALIDVIKSDGTIVPVLVYKIGNADERFSYAMKVEFLDGRNYSQETYFDRQGRIVKEVVRQEGIYILERSSPDELLVLFPEKAGGILQTRKMFEQVEP